MDGVATNVVVVISTYDRCSSLAYGENSTHYVSTKFFSINCRYNQALFILD